MATTDKSQSDYSLARPLGRVGFDRIFYADWHIRSKTLKCFRLVYVHLKSVHYTRRY